jgi:ABC-type branched-subunit amino acid transport system substrate-binding protein
MLARNSAVCALGAASIALLAACGSSGGGGGTATILIGVNVPSSADPFVAQYITRGAQLAVSEANQKGLTIAGTTYRLAVKVYDDAGQPQQSASNVDSAIHDGAVAVIEDGLGATISAAHTNAAGVPEIAIDNGDAGLLDPQNRPSLFRLGIANDASAGRLGSYISTITQSVAIIHDDSASGRDGANQLTMALATANATAAPVVEVAGAAPTLDAQVAQLVAAKPGAIAIWGTDTFVGKVAAALHTAGVTIPLFSGAQGESPAVRSIAGAAGSEGLRLVTSRMTSESDPSSFGQFEHRLAALEGGPTDAGFKNTEGQEIRQPNDRDLFSYDAVNLVVAALQKQNAVAPGANLIKAIGSVSVASANGDHRGFNPQNHEGVADDDMYIAVIHDMQFEPVKDEKLSATLPAQDEILANFH